MPKPHLSAALTQVQIDEINAKISEILNILDFGVNLTPKERVTMRKMGPKSVFYVELALEVARNHPEIIPAGFDVNEFKKDVLLSKALEEIFVVLSPLNEMLDDTRKFVGSECMKQADKVYSLVKFSSKGDDDMNKIKVKLGARFKDIGLNRGNPKRKSKKNVNSVKNINE